MSGSGSVPTYVPKRVGLAPRQRLLVALIALGVAVWGLTVAGPFRQFEAQVAGHELSPWQSTTTVGDVVYVGLGTPHTIGLRLTSECTSLLLMLPCVAAFGLFVSFWGVAVWRAVFGLAVAIAIEFLANQVRIFLIALSWWHWGSAGFWLSHTVVGSILSLVMALGGLFVQSRVTGVTAPASSVRRDY